jgi:acyl carrier protein
MDEQIREILRANAGLSVPASGIADDANLYALGMNSNASVDVMLALEDEFGIEFPERMLSRDVFESIASMRGALLELQGAVTS